jgi:hypothetical protein
MDTTEIDTPEVDAPMCQHITVVLINLPGQFAEVAKILGDAGVNILAFHVAGTGSNTVYAQLVCDDQVKALMVLTGKYHNYAFASEVLAFRTRNAPGQLYEILSALSKAEVNIDTAYQTLDGQGKAIIVIEPSRNDMQRAKDAVADRDDKINDFRTLWTKQ